MAITPKFTDGALRAMLQSRLEMIEEAVVMRLSRVGEQFVNDARDGGTYTDRTGNLRSSIGYVILKNGVQIGGGGFQQVGRGAQGGVRTKTGKLDRRFKKNRGLNDDLIGGNGSKVGQEVASGAAARYPVGYVLIVVAGMDYAAAVEANGRDVLSGSAPAATERLKKAMAALTRKIGQMQ